MTLKECYQQCKTRWEKLVKNPTDAQLRAGYCAACVFAATGCAKCPLLELWPRGCCFNEAPYARFCDAVAANDTKKAIQAAQQIVDFCAKKLEELP